MAQQLDQPPTSASSMDWRTLRTWLFKLWKSISNLTFGQDPTTYSAAVAALSAPGDGGLITGINGYGNTEISRRRSINGSMNVGQRGSVTVGSSNVYGGPDHYFALASTGAFTQASSTLTWEGINYNSLLQTVTTTTTTFTGTDYWTGAAQAYEGYQVNDFPGQPICISFLFKANWTGSFSVSFRMDASSLYSYTVLLACTANTPQLVSVSIPPVPLGVTVGYNNARTADLWIGAINFGSYECATANLGTWVTGASGQAICAQGATNWAATSGNTINITNLQLEVGASPTPFEWWTFNKEFLECCRYFQVGDMGFIGYAAAAGAYVGGWYKLLVPMRTNPAGTVSFGTPVENVNVSSLATTVWNAYDIRIWCQGTAVGNCYYDGPFSISSEIV